MATLIPLDPTTQRLHVMLFESSDPRRVFDDVGLATLIRDGWTLFAQFTADFGGEEGERIVIVLQPPRRGDAEHLANAAQATRDWVSEAWKRWRWWALIAYATPCLLLAWSILVAHRI